MAKATTTQSKTVTLTQARAIVTAHRTSASVNASRVRSLVPVCGKTPSTIATEVFMAYALAGETLPYAFGDTTVENGVYVARAWASLPVPAKRKIDKPSTDAILDALVGIRRTSAKLPTAGTGVTVGERAHVKRTKAGTKSALVGGADALSHLVSALAREEDAGKWLDAVEATRRALVGTQNAVTSGRNAAGKRGKANDDENLSDVKTSHDGRAGDAREGDEKAEKRNEKGKRKSKHERKSASVRDPLEPASEGNSPENLPGAGAGGQAPAGGKAPAKILSLADATLAQSMAHMRSLLADAGTKLTANDDAMFQALTEAWEERAYERPTKRRQLSASVEELVEATPIGEDATVARKRAHAKNESERVARALALDSNVR